MRSNWKRSTAPSWQSVGVDSLAGSRNQRLSLHQTLYQSYSIPKRHFHHATRIQFRRRISAMLAYRGMNASDRTIFGRQAARLEQLAAGSDEAREASDSAGGFAVFQSFMADTLNRGFDLSTIASRCRRLPPIQGAEVKAPVWHETSRQNGSRFGGISSAWRGEALPIGSSLGTFRRAGVGAPTVEGSLLLHGRATHGCRHAGGHLARRSRRKKLPRGPNKRFWEHH